jgi:SAM-dependent methyltransferase
LKMRAWFPVCLSFFVAAGAAAQAAKEPFQPYSGQPGKDVVWVPTPYALVEKMLDHAKVTPQDYVMDLGSGDGRNVIAAAKRGARALGVEFNADMVRLSRQNAEKAGVADKAKFVEGDMFAADISQATVLALFLLPDNLRRLTPKFQALRPGTRLVMNGFPIPDWSPDETEQASGDCGNWCTSHLYIVPAQVAGSWRLPQGLLVLEQSFQNVSGHLLSGKTKTPISEVQLRGDQFVFTAGSTKYSARVNGDTMTGEARSSNATRFTATRVRG